MLIADPSTRSNGVILSANPPLQPFRHCRRVDPFPRDPFDRLQNDLPDSSLVQVSRRSAVYGQLPGYIRFREVGRTGVAFRQALEQRLLMRSHGSSTSLVRACERQLFSIGFSRALRSPLVTAGVLKGALAPDFRLGERTRTTKDMNLVRRDNDVAAANDLIAAQTLKLDDFFSFTIEKVGAPGEMLEGVAVRYRVPAESWSGGGLRKSWSTLDSTDAGL